MTHVPDESGALWYDDDAGPMVRPYTVTRGRTLPTGRTTQMDVIALVSYVDDSDTTASRAADGASAAATPAAGLAPAGRPAEAVAGLPLAGPDAAGSGGAGGVASGAVAGGASGGLAGGSAGALVDAASGGVAGGASGGVAGGAAGALVDAASGGSAGAASGAVAGGAPDRMAGGSDPTRSPRGEGRARADTLGEEHLALLEHCRAGPLSVADLAAEADLPLGVVRVLLADLIDLGRVRMTRPVPPAELPDIGLLNHLIDGLRSL
ncbi:DUF742 domain-containing protein [Streptantibioticus silvisoli]